MTLAELIARCRSEFRDTKIPYLCSDAEWTDYLNEAEDEACIRSEIIEDSAIEIWFAAGDETVSIPERAFSIRSASVSGKSLSLYTLSDLDYLLQDGWEADTGEVVSCARNGNKLRLYPIPDAEGTLRITAFCTPESKMVGGDDEPTIGPTRLHVGLVDWALRCAYSKPDNDMYDMSMADRHAARFEAFFGPRPNAVEVRRRSIRRKRHARGNFF